METNEGTAPNQITQETIPSGGNRESENISRHNEETEQDSRRTRRSYLYMDEKDAEIADKKVIERRAEKEIIDPKKIPEVKKEARPQEGESEDPEKEKQEKPPQPKKHKVKVDGQEIEVDEDELKRGYSHQKAASRMLGEAKEIKLKAQKLFDSMREKSTFFQAAQELGHNPKDLLKEYVKANGSDPEVIKTLEEAVYERIKLSQMDPIELENLTLKQKLEQKEAMEKQRLQKVQESRMNQKVTEWKETYQKQIIEALPSSGLPQTKETVAQMAKYIGLAAKKGYALTGEEAAKLVRKDNEIINKNVISNMDGKQLLEFYGEEIADKILKARGERVKSPHDGMTSQANQATVRTPRSKAKPMSHSEWRKYNRGR